MDDKSFEKNHMLKKRSDDWIEITLRGTWKSRKKSLKKNCKRKITLKSLDFKCNFDDIFVTMFEEFSNTVLVL